MWMGEHQGLKVAVKALRVYSTSDFSKIINVGYFFGSQISVFHILTVTCTEVLQGGYNMEISSPSKCVTTVGSNNG